MQHLTGMAVTVKQMIRDLPDMRQAQAMSRNEESQQGPQAGGTPKDLQVCRQFRRIGTCSYGAKCKFEHEKSQGNTVMLVDPMV